MAYLCCFKLCVCWKLCRQSQETNTRELGRRVPPGNPKWPKVPRLLSTLMARTLVSAGPLRRSSLEVRDSLLPSNFYSLMPTPGIYKPQFELLSAPLRVGSRPSPGIAHLLSVPPHVLTSFGFIYSVLPQRDFSEAQCEREAGQ